MKAEEIQVRAIIHPDPVGKTCQPESREERGVVQVG